MSDFKSSRYFNPESSPEYLYPFMWKNVYWSSPRQTILKRKGNFIVFLPFQKYPSSIIIVKHPVYKSDNLLLFWSNVLS